MKNKCEPRVVKSILLGNYYYTDDYEDMGDGNILCNTKRDATQEEIDALCVEEEQ